MTHTQSIDLSAGFDIVSVPRSPFEFLVTDEATSFSPYAGMSQPSTPATDGQLPEVIPPGPATVSEWVEQQALPMVAPSVIVTTSSPEKKASQESPDSTEGQTSSHKVYNLTTLLQLGVATPMEHIELRIHPSALAGKLIAFSTQPHCDDLVYAALNFLSISSIKHCDAQYSNHVIFQRIYLRAFFLINTTDFGLENVFKSTTKTATSKPQSKPRHRGLSDISSLTNRTNKSEDEVVFAGREWNNALKPFREPREPPNGHFAQQNEGFKRFLKQVASPPHNRVTAGGRIVPAGLSVPPPKLNFNSIDSTIQQPISNPYSESSGVNAAAKSNLGTQANDAQAHGSLRPKHYLTDQNAIPSSVGQLETAQTQGHLVQNSHGGSEGNARLGAASFPQWMEPLYWLVGGGAIVAIDGLHYHASCNGSQLALDPLPSVSRVIPPAQPTIMYSQVAPSLPYATANQPLPAAKPQTSFANTGNPYYSYYPQYHDQPSSTNVNQLNNLRAQLMELDKYIALHLHKLSTFEHDTLVTQRRELVEQIDILRVGEKNGHSTYVSLAGSYPPNGMPLYLQRGMVQNFPSAVGSQAVVGEAPQSMASAASNKNETAQIASKATSLAFSTSFSPDAPPFVPAKIREMSGKPGPSITSGAQHGNIHAQIPQINNTAASHAFSAETFRATEVSHVTSHKPGEGPNRGAPGSKELLRDTSLIVLEEDVEYVNRLGLNPAHGEKLYCSTVAEFQEVIRRVREQAVMYGCKGGQSKDPAFDAEQDIRWAMADHDPIALPSLKPDHIAKPRPWSWNDSAFNVRANKHVPAGMNTNATSSSTYVASNSWRISSGPNTQEEEFNIFTHRRADSRDSNPGVNGLIDVTIPLKHPELGLTAEELAEAAANGVKFKVKGGPEARPFTPSYAQKGVSNMRSIRSDSALLTPSKSTKQYSPPETHRPYQAYIEDALSSPTTNRVKSISRNLTHGSTQMGHSSSDSATKSNGEEDAFDLWLKGPINPIYDWGSGKLISTGDNAEMSTLGLMNMLHCERIKGTDHVAGFAEPTKGHSKKPHDSWAPITDSKARWGPEQDTASADAFDVRESNDWAATK